LKAYSIHGDEDSWIFGIKNHHNHVWELFGNTVFCSCIYWSAPIGEQSSPLAMSECQNCEGHGIPPVPWTEVI